MKAAPLSNKKEKSLCLLIVLFYKMWTRCGHGDIFNPMVLCQFIE